LKVTFDHTKNTKNIELRGLSFERAADFEFATAWIVVDDRKNYGETRYRAIGFFDKRLHALVFTETQSGIRVRVILTKPPKSHLLCSALCSYLSK
jgi:uncharacterized DUF497 family protein